MAQANGGRIITALDVGTWKVSALIAELQDNGEMQVLGTGQRESRGVKRGYVADMDATEKAIRETVEQAERIAGTNIEDVWVNFSAGGLASDIAPVEVELAGHRIEQSDIDELLSAGRGLLHPDGRMILHAQPTLYTLDGLNGVKNPLGLHADTLSVDIHVVLADGSPVRNLDLCVRRAHLEVKSIVAAPVATGLSCLSDEERELGVALVEMGAGVTNVSLFIGGMLVGLTSLPFGASDITDDIASAFATKREHAERIKCFFGSATASPRDNHDMIDMPPMSEDDGGADVNRITRAQLIAVIRQRLDHMMGEIARTLKDMGFTGPVGRQAVLTGGGAELKGLADFAQGALGRAVRIGRPRRMAGLPDAHSGPGFSTLAGLVHYAASDPVDLRTIAPSHQIVTSAARGGVLQRFLKAFRTGY
ncbi:MAG: cell division protein FtsA [Sphingomonadales bacterium]|jgi:cell division protein FtsA|nr:cell division protein FtsA [Sphingomonadales bacterium]